MHPRASTPLRPAVLFFSMGHIWLPGNAAFCSVLIWACSLVLAEVARWVSGCQPKSA